MSRVWMWKCGWRAGLARVLCGVAPLLRWWSGTAFDSGMGLEEQRAAFGRKMASSAAVGEESAIARVFASTPREAFVGPPPWRIFGEREDRSEVIDDPALLYRDVLVQLKGEAAINNGQPSLHAICMTALHVRPGETAVHVGAGTGYYTAMLAQLVGPSGRVEAYEIENDLAWRAAENLRGMSWVRVHAGSGTVGPLPECDVLYVSAGATAPLAVWLDALRVGGRLLFPLTPDDGAGAMLLVTRWPERYAARFVCGAKFVGCAGARDAVTEKRVAECFRRGHAARVRSLRRDDAPDETAWCVGDGWWLSMAE
jgi:protein-L-isoaspartate(D-aspartate) O-methyltransferase